MPDAMKARIIQGSGKRGCCSDDESSKGLHASDLKRAAEGTAQSELAIRGMTCKGCVGRIEDAISALPGVVSISVDLNAESASVVYDPEIVGSKDLRSAVEEAGYRVSDKKKNIHLLQRQQFRMKPVYYGIVTVAAAVIFYLGLITLTSDWYNARMQFLDYRWWLAALAAGLGVQVSLYVALRRSLRGKGLHAANTSVAASGGMSTAAMAACCSHYLAVFLPLIGLPFLSAAAAGLERYQVEFFATGVLFNVAGIALMARQLKTNDVPFAAALR